MRYKLEVERRCDGSAFLVESPRSAARPGALGEAVDVDVERIARRASATSAPRTRTCSRSCRPRASRLGLAALARVRSRRWPRRSDELEGMGYVERRPNPRDRRSRLVFLTERGEAVKPLTHATAARVEEHWAQLTSPEELEALRAVPAAPADRAQGRVAPGACGAEEEPRAHLAGQCGGCVVVDEVPAPSTSRRLAVGISSLRRRPVSGAIQASSRPHTIRCEREVGKPFKT